MPGTSTTGSTNIALLDSKIIASLCNGAFHIDVSPSIFIASGASNVLGANVQIINPFGIIVKPYGANYEIAPPMTGVIDFDIPTQAGNFQYGKYTVDVKLFDADGTSWVITKPVQVCVPDKKNKTRNYGSLSAILNGSCVDGKLYVIVDGIPNYNGVIVESQVLTGTLEYPTSSGLPVLTITEGNFSVVLFEGVYKLVGEICATYNFGDNVFVKVKYKVKKEKNIRCLIDRCCVFAKLQEIHLKAKEDCTQEEKDETASISVDALLLLETIELAANCGEDPSDYIEDLEKLLGCKCTCNCAEGTPIVNNTPSSDVIIQGCNTSVNTNGLTKTYTIENYAYQVEIAPNGGALIVSTSALASCTKTQTITFDISVVYAQIKALANGDIDPSKTQADFWASIVNKSIDATVPTCLTDDVWMTATFKQRFQILWNKICSCCSGCNSSVSNIEASQSGGDVSVSWDNSDSVYAVAVYLDGILQGTVLASIKSFTFVSGANGEERTFRLVPICIDGSFGTPVEDTFSYLGCPTVAPTLFTDDVVDGLVSNVSCPFDLTSLESLSNPETAEWHTANNTNTGTIVDNPAAVAGGSFYVFNKNGDGCYSVGQKITILCNAEASCTAPQNLTVSRVLTNNFFIQFQSAAYPPPGNSYTVKRRLASDPDVGGSYTTIGTPVWDAGFNRWILIDHTAVDNTLYVYRAISNCGSTEPSVDYVYANIVCPGITTYPTSDSISYSFVPIGSAASIVVELLDSSGTVLISYDTYNPAYGNPTEGLFEYLEANTTYKIRLKITLTNGDASITKTCSQQTVTTDEEIVL